MTVEIPGNTSPDYAGDPLFAYPITLESGEDQTGVVDIQQAGSLVTVSQKQLPELASALTRLAEQKKEERT